MLYIMSVKDFRSINILKTRNICPIFTSRKHENSTQVALDSVESTPVLSHVNMNSIKLVIPLHSLYWSIHTKDESKRGTAFAFIFGVN